MLEIIILEDNQRQLDWLTSFISRYTTFEELDTTIKMATTDIEKVKKFVETCDHQNVLYFLSIEINQENSSIDLAEQIRHKMPLASIVFITAYEELSLVTLERRLAPLDYICKSKDTIVIEEAIRQDIIIAQELVIKHMQRTQEKFVYRLRNHYYEIPMSDIMYIASKPNQVNRVIVHAQNMIVEINDSLLNIEKKYQKLFRCHKGFIVNLTAIHYFDIETNRVYFDDQNKIWCPLSIRKKRQFKKAWHPLRHFI